MEVSFDVCNCLQLNVVQVNKAIKNEQHSLHAYSSYYRMCNKLHMATFCTENLCRGTVCTVNLGTN